MTYLIIGYDADPCCAAVAATLRDRGAAVVVTPDPFADSTCFSWTLESERSVSTLRPVGGPVIDAADIRGVLVRSHGGPIDPGGWDPDDFLYVQTETQAALLAWLADLPCAVVNRPSADLWFRPYRPLLAWHGLFRRCNLPTLAALVTNDLAQAREFAAAFGGTATYRPMTSSSRYPIASEDQWADVGKVLAHVPASFFEPVGAVSHRICVAGHRYVWGGGEAVGAADRGMIEAGARCLANELGAATLELELCRGRNGLRCTAIDLFPDLGGYDEESQAEIVDELVTLLGASA
jgi:hypothetical protein